MTNIEWTDSAWNPIRGCSRVSAGCLNCYAERQAIRQIRSGYAGLIKRTSHGPAWTGEVRLVPQLLDAPLRWRNPQRIFVNSMSDLFHEKVPDETIDRVFAIMAMAPQHTFQALTKRPDRMLRYLGRSGRRLAVNDAMWPSGSPFNEIRWPLPNVWLGVSVEDQAAADERIPLLLEAPAAVRFVSYEPALGPVEFAPHLTCKGCGTRYRKSLRPGAIDCCPDGSDMLDWLIVGGESGQGARPCDVAWIRSAVEQCREASVPVFVKQMGANVTLSSDEVERMTGARTVPHRWELRDRKGGDPAEWPEDLRVRQFPGGPQVANEPEPPR